MQVTAKLMSAPMSAQKCRLVANQVRGLPVERVLAHLTFSTKKAARFIKKLIESAIANAEHNAGADIDELRLSLIYVDEGKTAKRIRPRAKGRANRILKRSCHITVGVSANESEE